MGNSKIVYYGETLIDLTGDTVEPAKLLKGVTAHDKKGAKITGTFEAADPYAIISVTYTEGSVCTCSNGSVTLTAKDTSGKAMFIIPSAGTWTVKAVKGSQSASKAVEITAEGQIENVALSYRLYLFNNGVVEGVAWDKVKKDQWNYGTLTIGDTIELFASSYWDANYYVIAGIGTAIDLTDFTTLKAHIAKDEGGGNAWIYIGTRALSGDTITQKIPIESGGGTISVDISSLTGSYFVSLDATGTNSGSLKSRRIGYDIIYLE